MNRPILLVIGTRPEGIKMAPVYFALKAVGIPTIICSTSQHTSLLEEVCSIFGIVPDIKLNIMRPNQNLSYIATAVLQEMEKVYAETNPTMVLVQGDTATTFSAALAAFYYKIPVGHIEAGLRTGDIYSPFPEEMNRKLIGSIASIHFAPTRNAVDNLLSEGIKRESIFYVGNTVKDALRIISEKLVADQLDPVIVKVVNNCKSELMVPSYGSTTLFELRRTGTTSPVDVSGEAFAKTEGNEHVKPSKKLVVVTAHRRESFDGGILNILTAIKEYADSHPDIQFIYPAHPNPNVLAAIEKSGIKNCKNVLLLGPISYPNLVYVLKNVDIVVTDSGGIQEEATCFGKPTVVVREHTDRPEAVSAGFAQVVGIDKEKIMQGLDYALFKWTKPLEREELYGDGFAAEKIALIVNTQVNEKLENSARPERSRRIRADEDISVRMVRQAHHERGER